MQQSCSSSLSVRGFASNPALHRLTDLQVPNAAAPHLDCKRKEVSVGREPGSPEDSIIAVLGSTTSLSVAEVRAALGCGLAHAPFIGVLCRFGAAVADDREPLPKGVRIQAGPVAVSAAGRSGAFAGEPKVVTRRKTTRRRLGTEESTPRSSSDCDGAPRHPDRLSINRRHRRELAKLSVRKNQMLQQLQ